MPFRKIDPASVQLEFDESKSYPSIVPVSLADLKVAVDSDLFEAVEELCKALNLENTDNIFTVKLESVELGENLYLHNFVSIYSFSLQTRKDQLCLTFGGNEIPVTGYDRKSKSFAVTDDVSIVMSARDLNDEKSLASFSLLHDGNYFPLFGVLKDDVTFWTLEGEKTLESVTKHFDSLGGGAFAKLVDFVRDDVERGVKKLAKPIILDVVSWEIKPPKDEFKKSYVFEIQNAPQAKTKDGQYITPKYVNINDGFTAFKLMESPGMTRNGQIAEPFAERAIKAIENGGKLLLVITAPSNKNPDKWRPEHSLTIFENPDKIPSAIKEQLALAGF